MTYDPVQAFADWAALKSREMFTSPIDSQQPPQGWVGDRHYDQFRPKDINGWPLAMIPERYRPGMVVDPHPLPDILARLRGE